MKISHVARSSPARRIALQSRSPVTHHSVNIVSFALQLRLQDGLDITSVLCKGGTEASWKICRVAGRDGDGQVPRAGSGSRERDKVYMMGPGQAVAPEKQTGEKELPLEPLESIQAVLLPLHFARHIALVSLS